MSSETDIIKDKLNILDVVGQYVKLEKAGKTYKGKSPFNSERTPSFFVSPDKGFFYCFSSGKGGDIFTFIQEVERVEFPEALKMLAERAGVELSSRAENKELKTERDRLFHLIDLATKFYEVNLRKNKEVVDYLLARGLTKETIIKFRIGFARDSWRDIYDYLKSKKFTDSEIERAGLAVPKQGSGHYDRFRSRIMFPLFDGRGRVVGFSGRIFGDEQDLAKYINSPEGPLFDKSKVLYGYHNAKSAMSKEDYCILVEGQLDVLLSQQSGYENTVAISGTGLTEGHINMIKRFTSSVYLALDSDNAGIKATRRSILEAYKYGMRVKIILLNDGEDPADTIKRSKEAWDVALLEPQEYVDYRIILSEKNNPDFEQKQDLISKDLFEIVYHTQSSVSREHFLSKIALFLGVSLDAVKNDFEKYSPQEEIEIINEDQKTAETISLIDQKKDLHKEIILIQEFFPELFKDIEKEIHNNYFSFSGKDIFEEIEEMRSEERAMLVFAHENKGLEKDFKKHKNTIFSLLKSVELKELQEQSSKIGEEIKREQILNPNTLPTELMRKSESLRKKIDELKNQ